MMWDLPISVEIDGKEYAITNKCDYRMVLDVICALNDKELDEDQKISTALYILLVLKALAIEIQKYGNKMNNATNKYVAKYPKNK